MLSCYSRNMSRYRRSHVPGGSYFFTVATYRRRRILTQPDVLDALRAAIRNVRAERPLRLDGLVLLPDHLHAIWTLPAGDDDYGTRWSIIKRRTSKTAQHLACGRQSDSRLRRRELGFWQRRFWEHLIRDETDYERHMDYLHFNPVKHGLVEKTRDWPYSTFHRYVRLGVYPLDWADEGESDLLADGGEPGP